MGEYTDLKPMQISEKSKISFVLITILLLFTFSLSAQEQDFSFPLSTHELKNGLTVILSEDNSLPLVSVVVAYNVGSLHDRPGKTGLAYLLENMMFQGSRNVGQMQHISYLDRIGGEFNAETRPGMTLFYQTVPSNQLALVLWLESDRMNSLSITETNVQEVKDSLIEEIQLLHEEDPYRESSLYFDQLLYANPAYSHPTVGASISDIRNITVRDVSQFYSEHYAPDNAVLSIAGNIDINKTVQLIRRYFDSIPAGKDRPLLNLETPPRTEAIEETQEDILASYPGFYLGYRLESPFTDDFYSLSLIEYALFRGKSSRLVNRLLNERERIAFQLQGGIEKKKDFAVLKIFVLANEEVMQERCRRAVFSEINRLRSNPLSEKELNRVKNLFKADYLRRFETVLGKAIFLAENYLERNSLDEIFDQLNKYMQIPSARITGIMNRYFSQGSILLNINLK